MSDQLFSVNRLNRRIIDLLGMLYAVSDASRQLIETPSDESAATLSEMIESYSAHSDAMLSSLSTLLSQQNSVDPEETEVDGLQGQDGIEL
jgi:hypothetical protein